VPVWVSGEILLGDLYRLPILFSDEAVTSGDLLIECLVVLIVHGFMIAPA